MRRTGAGIDGVPGAGAYARAYLFFGLLAVLTLSVTVPPYLNPDEIAHFKRAEHVSRGGLAGENIGGRGGGTISAEIDATAEKFADIAFHPDKKATRERFDSVAPMRWTGGTVRADFSNTAIYPPLFYLPSAAGILVGKAAMLNVVNTISLSRALNGVVCVLMGAFAIAIAGAAAPWIFVLLSLPMSLSLMASVSQDGPMLAVAALAAAIFAASYLRGQPDVSAGRFAAMCLSIALVAMARPVYAALAVLPLLASGHRWNVRLTGAAAVLAAVGFWALLVSPIAPFAVRLEADPPAQLAYLRSNPLALLVVMARTVKLGLPHYLEAFVGRLGWLDVALPAAYHWLAWVALLVAAAATAAGLRTLSGPFPALLLASALTAACFGLLLIQYLVWSHPAHRFVEGVQGRYFIPLAFFIAAVLPSWRNAAAPKIRRAAFPILAGFALLSVAVTLYAVIRRYYV